ncbi:MAG: FtsQ-type POTRA domain-containing protein [Candidatus Magasanikbacteria bacterium]
MLIFASALILSWIATLVYLPYFRITKVNYIGLQVIKKNEIDSDISGKYFEAKSLLPKNNYFLMSANEMEKYLTQNYSLSKITVKKEFPNKILIDLEEKISTVIFDNGFDYYLLDQKGSIVRHLAKVAPSEVIDARPIISTTTEVSSSTISTFTERIHLPNYKKIKSDFGPFPIIYDSRSLINTSTEQILSADLIAGVINFYTQTEKQGIANIKYLVLDMPLAGVTAKTDRAWDIYFQPLENISTQLSNLKLIVKANKPNEYIDLRYGGRVYWK